MDAGPHPIPGTSLFMMIVMNLTQMLTGLGGYPRYLHKLVPLKDTYFSNRTIESSFGAKVPTF